MLKTLTFKYNASFRLSISKTKYETKIIGSTPDNSSWLETEVFVSLKHLSIFWRSLDFPLIICEIELDLSWSKDCIISEISRAPERDANLDATSPVPTVAATEINSATFKINNAKLYVPVVKLSVNNNIKYLENIKQGFKRTVSWNKCKSEIIAKPRDNNLDYMIDPTFRIINELFVLSFKNAGENPTKNSFDKCYMPLVEIKDFNGLINNKPFFDQPVKNKLEAYETLVKMTRNNDYAIENLLYYLYNQNYDRLIGIDLSRQKIRLFLNKLISQKNEKKMRLRQCFFLAKKQQKTENYFKFFIEFIKRNRKYGT